MDTCYSTRDLIQRPEVCGLASTLRGIDQSFLGLDRIRCALHARHSMLCNTTYSGLRPLPAMFGWQSAPLWRSVFLHQSGPPSSGSLSVTKTRPRGTQPPFFAPRPQYPSNNP